MLTITSPVYKGERCRGCPAELVFVLTQKGRREPLERAAKTWTTWDELLEGDGAPLTALRIVAGIDGAPAVSLSLKAARALGYDVEEHPETPVHVAHFATCPERDRFRRAR